MCPYTLVHNKMLASTMQHSTHNHTPTHHDHHHTHNRDALGNKGQEPEATPTTTNRGRCPLRTQQRAQPSQPQSREQPQIRTMFHPATPTTLPERRATRMESRKRRTNHSSPKGQHISRSTPPHGET